MRSGVRIAIVGTAAGLAFTGLSVAAFAATSDTAFFTSSEQTAIEESNRAIAEQFLSDQEAAIAELTAQLSALQSELTSTQASYDAAVAAANAATGGTMFASPPAGNSPSTLGAPQAAQTAQSNATAHYDGDDDDYDDDDYEDDDHEDRDDD